METIIAHEYKGFGDEKAELIRTYDNLTLTDDGTLLALLDEDAVTIEDGTLIFYYKKKNTFLL